MANIYKQSPVVKAETRFSAAPMSDVEHSRLTATPAHYTTLNAGDIVPIYCREILPNQGMSMRVDFVIRPNTVKTPTFGNMFCDIYAFFVPNRIINMAWKNVMGENTSGMWVAPEVSLVPLYSTRSGVSDVQIPIGSVADYYGFPTQAKIPAEVLQQCHDLKFRGYLDIYNEYFRNENYQPPIPFSKLNVYEGFLEPKGTSVSLNAADPSNVWAKISEGQASDGSSPAGSIQEALFGEGSEFSGSSMNIPPRVTSWSALDVPLKANRLKDYFTSCLPSPQKGPEVLFNVGRSGNFPTTAGMQFNVSPGTSPSGYFRPLFYDSSNNVLKGNYSLLAEGTSGLSREAATPSNPQATQMNLAVNIPPNTNIPLDLSEIGSISLTDIRDAAAIQQVYEILARGGSRYRSMIASFFGVDVQNPFDDIPRYLGHIRKKLDLYQTAQTSPSVENGTPQGNLAAFGYTATGDNLFQSGFIEHGYLHIFAVVRHKNIYASYFARDNFRLNAIDFYTPPLANISEQPVYTREINPFDSNHDDVFGFQEAWAEYRYEPDYVTGYMRPGIEESLSIWNYADEFDSGLRVLDGDFLKSNAQEVLDRTLAVTSSEAPQYKAAFWFTVDKELPMPTYSVPGLDII